MDPKRSFGATFKIPNPGEILVQSKMKKTKEQLAKEHADWFARITKKVFYDAFIHGYKHGRQR